MKIVIAGAAGTLGSAVAFNIASHDLADEIVMIDPRERELTSHWADLSTAVTGKDISVLRGTYEAMTGSAIVLVAASVPLRQISSRRDSLPGNLPIIKEIALAIDRFCPEAVVLTASNPVDSLNYAMYLLSTDKDRRRFVGYSLNDTMRFQMASAAVLGKKSSGIEGMAIGEHGDSLVLLFSTLKADGRPVRVDEELRKKIKEEAPRLLRMLVATATNRTAGWTSAIGLTRIVSAIINDTGELIPSSAVLDGEYGCKGLSMAVPAHIGRRGIQGIEVLQLTPDEHEGLRRTVEVLSQDMRYVEKNI
jgi:malate/lactate dehydrogenase